MKSSGPVIILHFSPPEQYPPVMNLLNTVSGQNLGCDWLVYTTPGGSSSSKFSVQPGSRVRIIRKGWRRARLAGLARWLTYFSFYGAAIYRIWKTKPRAVLYYETISGLPAIVAKRFLGYNGRLMLHYHEYVTPREYAGGSLLFRMLYRLEKPLLPSFDWISQTNEDRVRLFASDLPGIDVRKLHVVPNFPPAAWNRKVVRERAGLPLRIVYIGAVSADTMYLNEFAMWVKSHSGKLSWDIYSLSPHPSALALLDAISADNIRMAGPVDYDRIPEVLCNYDVGVILYKGHIPNFIHNAPNKLFEYHVNGLDVWFPSVMTGCRGYATTGSYPRIMELDFDKLSQYSPEALADRVCLVPELREFSCEQALTSIINELVGNS